MQIYSVSQLTRKIRQLLEIEVGEVWVEGEVSNYRKQSSGHQYFTLKDPHAQIACVFFRGQAWNNRVPIQEGAKLRVFGELSLYEVRGQYQLVVRQVKTIGAGNLHQRFEALKAKLKAEGLFDSPRKQSITRYPKRLAIVTSPTGAAIQDLRSTLKRRAPWVDLVIYPVPVQGDGAFLEIIDALDRLGKRTDIDTIILARGGGSLEDLWSFNEEGVARAIVRCPIPIVCGVGHETDFTISDFVADQRAPTPTAAAELATPDRMEMQEAFRQRQRTLNQLAHRALQRWQQQLHWYQRSAGFQAPRRRLESAAQWLDDRADALQTIVEQELRDYSRRLDAGANALRMLKPANRLQRYVDRLETVRTRLHSASERHLTQFTNRIESMRKQLRALGPAQTLARGYSITVNDAGHIVRSVADLATGDRVTIRLTDGESDAEILSRSLKREE